MLRMGRICDTLIERFPDHRGQIERLFNRNALFQSFCEEYQDAVAALKRWAAKGHEGADTRKDWELMVYELEEEFLEFLSKDDTDCWPP
jgi:hypothetical protein